MRRFLGGSALIALFSAVAVGTAVFEGISTVADAFNRGALVKSPDITPAAPGAPQTIMIVGSDKRYLSKDVIDRNDPPHTDTILLVRLDPRAGAVTVLSVPRDLLVPSFSFHAQTYVNQKINYAYTVGSLYGKSSTAGDELALAVVKQALGGIVINDFIDLNFETFEKVVAQLGCVYVDVDHAYYHRNYPGEPSDESRRSTSTPATSRSATTAHSPTCATATPTARSPATPASRTSYARRRTSSGSPDCSRTTRRC